MEHLSSLTLTHFDIAVISLIIISTLLAIARGFIKSLISFIGWISAFIISLTFNDTLAPIISTYTTSKDIAILTSTATIFLLSVVVISIINSIIGAFLSILCGNILDRSLGIFFGLARGCFLASFSLYFAIFTMPELDVKNKSDVYEDNENLPHWAQNSELLLLTARGASFIGHYIPENLANSLKTIIEEYQDEDSLDNKDDNDDNQGNKKSFFSDNASSNPKSMTRILDSIPEDVLNDISQKNLIALQDPYSSPETKVRILESISDTYQKYLSTKVHYGSSSKSEARKINESHHKVLMMIENEIKRNNHISYDNDHSSVPHFLRNEQSFDHNNTPQINQEKSEESHIPHFLRESSN